MKRNLIFIGMPAVGKSTVGIVVAKRLGMRFVDTDLLIQEREGKLPAAVRQAADQDDILHTVIASISIAFQQTGKAFQEVLRMLPLPSRLVFIQRNGRQTIIPCRKDPHV